MKALVLDCSVAIQWLGYEPGMEKNTYAMQILELVDPGNSNAYRAVVPGIWTYELVNVLYNIERFREIDKAQILEFLYILRAIHIELDDHQHDVLRTDLLEISRTYTISSYDAAYIEVALRKNLPIATLDRKLMQVAEKAGIKILTLS